MSLASRQQRKVCLIYTDDYFLFIFLVILFDSDWNSQQDVQAQARVHRIGQTKDVRVYRLLCARTYEEAMFEAASRKLALDRTILGTGNAKSEGEPKTKFEVETMLRKGAYAVLLQNESDEAKSKEFSEATIDAILERNTRVIVGGPGDSSNRSAFSSATFMTTAGENLRFNDADFWNKIGLVKSAVKSLGRRSRHKLTSNGLKDQKVATSNSSSDTDSSQKFSKMVEENGKHGDISEPDEVGLYTHWSKQEREEFIEGVCTFGIERWQTIKERFPALSRKSIQALQKYFVQLLSAMMQAIANDDQSEDIVTMHSDLNLKAEHSQNTKHKGRQLTEVCSSLVSMVTSYGCAISRSSTLSLTSDACTFCSDCVKRLIRY